MRLPGIPITDFLRMAQADGMKVISFRHEQHAGNAAAAHGYLTGQARHLLHGVGPGVPQRPHRARERHDELLPMILVSGSSEREIVDLQQGDYEEMDQLAIAKPLCKAAYRVLHAEDIGVGVARAIRSALSGRPGGVYLDLPAKLFAQIHPEGISANKSLDRSRGPGGRSRFPPRIRSSAAIDMLRFARKPLVILGKGAAYAPRRCGDPQRSSKRPACPTCRCR